MKKHLILIAITLIILSNCKNSEQTAKQERVSETKTETDLSAIATKDFREFKVLDSKYLTNKTIWKDLNGSLLDFSESDYLALKSLILDQNIATLQKHISTGKLTYETLTKFYLFRIRKFDRENDLSLNSIISINPNVIEEAKQKDREFLNKKLKHPIFGMPILLKDNINASGMPTTAGALALKDNHTEDAFIVKRLKSKGALILGKANLSEWAYFFCGNCPSGYSAIGGQTLNPYGRRLIDTGGSSSGSAVAVAANFCVAALGSETAGSILSPASQNSVVGLKPTVGLVSRSGIIPISSTLDTAGPITKNVYDNAIVLDAIFGNDASDSKSINSKLNSGNFWNDAWKDFSIKGKRFGAFKKLIEDELYASTLKLLETKGATIIEIESPEVELPSFLRLLNLDMKTDLPTYFKNYGNVSLGFKSIEDIIAFNKKDSINTMPYGQNLFNGIAKDKATKEEFDNIKTTLKINGRLFFDEEMKSKKLDGILSINNYHAAFAAVAEYPALTVPMGYMENGEPKGLTFISKPQTEKQLLEWAYVFEQAKKARVSPKNYK